MKLVPFILGMLVFGAHLGILQSISDGFKSFGTSISNGFKSLTDSASKGTEELENGFKTLVIDSENALGIGSDDKKETVKTDSLNDQLLIYVNQQSESKTKHSENAIANMFTENGDLSTQTINGLLIRAGQQYLERDYHMERSKHSVQEIIDCLNNLAKIEGSVAKYQSPDEFQTAVISGTEINQQIYTSVNALFENRTAIKQDMLVLSQNIEFMKRNDFDLSAFYFDGKYNQEVEFLTKRSQVTAAQLYNVYNAQMSVFESRVRQMEVIYDQFNKDLAEIYDSCERVFGYYLEQQRKAELVRDVPNELSNELNRMFRLRRDFAEKLLVFQASLANIASQRDLMATIFEFTSEVEDAVKQTEEINENLQRESGFKVGFTQKQKERLKRLSKENEEDKKEMIEIIAEAVEDQNDPTLTVEERKERESMRKAKIAAYLQKIKSRQTEIDAIEQSLKDAQLRGENIDDSESDEEFFRKRAEEEKKESLVNDLKRKIDKGEIQMSEVTDKDVSDKIAQKEIAESKGTVVVSEVTTEEEVPENKSPELEPVDMSANQEEETAIQSESVVKQSSVFDNIGRKLLANNVAVLVCSWSVLVLSLN